jgi:hypothetical protein
MIDNIQILALQTINAIERNATVSGSVYGTMNLFRNILPES